MVIKNTMFLKIPGKSILVVIILFSCRSSSEDNPEPRVCCDYKSYALQVAANNNLNDSLTIKFDYSRYVGEVTRCSSAGYCGCWGCSFTTGTFHYLELPPKSAVDYQEALYGTSYMPAIHVSFPDTTISIHRSQPISTAFAFIPPYVDLDTLQGHTISVIVVVNEDAFIEIHWELN